jgi:acyl-CoA thioester hydrolase
MDEPIASPCRNICRLDHQQVCVGCGRTIGEIAEWPAASEPRRRQIVQDAARRMWNPAMANQESVKAPTGESHRLDDFAHRIELPVRWGDMDAMAHVNNAKIVTYGESGRIAYFDELAASDPTFWNDHGMILAHVGVDFVAQLRYPATLQIGTRIWKLGRSSLHMLTVIFSEGKIIAVVKAVIAWFDYVNQKTMPIPDPVRDMIRRRERIAPEE